MNNYLKSPVLRIACLLLIGSAVLLFVFKVIAQDDKPENTNTSPTPTSTPTPPPTPTPIPVSEIIIQKEKTEKKLQEIEKKIAEEDPVPIVKKELVEFVRELDEKEKEANLLLVKSLSLESIRELEQDWSDLARIPFLLKDRLQIKATERNKQQDELSRIFISWEKSLRLVENPPELSSLETETPQAKDTIPAKEIAGVFKSQKTEKETPAVDEKSSRSGEIDKEKYGDVPDDVKERIRKTVALIEVTKKKVGDSLGKILNLEGTISETQKRISDFQEMIKATHDRALSNLVRKDSPAIWEGESFHSGFGQDVGKSISVKVANLTGYLVQYRITILNNIIAILILTFVFYKIRRSTRRLVAKEPELSHGLEIFESPIAIAVLLGVIFDSSIYLKMPELFDSFMNLVGLTAMFFLIKHFVKGKYDPVLIGVLALYIANDFRSLFATIPLLSRVWFLAEMLGGIVFLIWFNRSKGFLGETDSTTVKRVRIVSIALMVIFASAFIAKSIGYVGLAGIIGDSVITSILFGVFYYILVQFSKSLLTFVFRVPPFSRLMMVKNHGDLIQNKIGKYLLWLAVFFWINLTLSLLYLAGPIWASIISFLTAGFEVGSISISVGGIVIFILTVFLSFWLSRFIRFALEEDVYTRVNLAEGMPYAASTILHYLILLFGFFIALAALGFDLNKFTILAGAFGVGLSFGLQNMVENFSSGLILLLERPVKVGDLVETNQFQGNLKQIGLRASIVRTVQGSEVIVPNGHLISQEVTNWTLSDPMRRIDIEVGVEYGTNLRKVTKLLEDVGNRYVGTEIPPAKAIFTGFGDSSLDFQLRVWTTNDEDWIALKSDLSIDVSEALEDAGIEIPFVQRDLNLKSVDEKVLEKIKLVRNEKTREKK